MRPLESIRVLALEQYGAGPWGSLHLADLGAEVIKIEDPRFGGDVGRYVPPYFEGEDSLFFEALNRNKRSISLDLTSPSGRKAFEDLVRHSDIVYSNLRGDVPEKIGIRYDDLKHINSAIVCCSLSGFGMTGPRRGEPGYDYVLQAMTGWMDLTGDPGGPPTKSGLSLVDFSGGFVAATAMLAALHAARRDGVGSDCDVSLYDTALSMLNYVAAWHLNAGFEPARMADSAHPSLVPFQAFEANDGWLVIACAKEKFWVRLTQVLDRPQWADDPRFTDFSGRNQQRDILIPMIQERIRSRSVAEWLDDLRAAGVPAGPVQSVADALTDPQTEARGMVIETEHPRWGVVRSIASPVRIVGDVATHRRAPRRNEDRDVVMGIAGYSADMIETAERAGAFGARVQKRDAQ